MVVELEKIVIVFEFKLDQSAESALQQIIEKKYADKFSKHGKHVVLIGASFSSKSRNVSEWKVQK